MGREINDGIPVEWPVGVTVPESLEQKIARMVRVGVSQFAQDHGAETFDEADDFDVPDPEALPGSVHELDDDQERIAADLAAVRRIPPQFREAFERYVERKRAKAEADLRGVEKPTPPADLTPEPKGGKEPT